VGLTSIRKAHTRRVQQSLRLACRRAGSCATCLYPIHQFKELQDLGEDIAKRALATGMLKDVQGKIDDAVLTFSDPTKRKIHERPIFWKEVSDAGLIVQHVDNRSELWLLISDLHQRAHLVVSTRYAKILETCDQEFAVPRESL